MNRGFSIGVIGGAAAAVCILDALEQATGPAAGRAGWPPGEVTIFEPSNQLWRGRPYQRDTDAVRVNIPPAGMSIRQGDTGHFRRWLEATGQPAGPQHPQHDPHCDATFVSRSVYGDYLEYAAATAIERLRERGWQVELVRQRVIEAAPTADLVALRSQDGQVYTVNYAVLCVGAGPPRDSYELAGQPGFVPEPYPLGRTLDAIADADSVGVVGSGLTGVDTVLSLAARGYQGEIRLLSRSGVLPAVRQQVVPLTLRHFTAEHFRALAARGERTTLAAVAATMATEVTEAGGSWPDLVVEVDSVDREDPVARLDRQLASITAADPGLRILQRAVPDTGPDVWPLLSVVEQRQVLSARYRTVMSLCCPMPPTSALRLRGLLSSGQLVITPDVHQVRPADGGGFTVSTGAAEHRVAAVVNAVNPSPHYPHPASQSLIDSLVQAGVTVRHPLGGVEVVRSTSGLTVAGTTSHRIYALGALAAGSLFFTFGMPSVVDRADDIVRAVVANAESVSAIGLPAGSATP